MAFVFKNLVSESYLKGVEIPNKTWSYAPVEHSMIIDLLKEKMNEFSLKPISVNWTSKNEGKKMIGLIDIDDSKDKEMGFRIAVRNSYDSSMSFGIAIGSVVWICSNGCISGDITGRKIHRGITTVPEIKQIISEGFDQYAVAHLKMQKLRDNLKQINASKEMIGNAIGNFYMNGVFNGVILKKCLSEVKHSRVFNSYDNNKEDLTMWDLYMHATEALKLSNLPQYTERHIMTTNYFSNMVENSKTLKL